MIVSGHLPLVALVGRPNVGKSTLFNRLIGQRRAVVHSEPGVTRDRLVHTAEWLGQRFMLVDTGGIGFEQEMPVGDLVRDQVEEAILSANVILFCVDVVAGVTPLDQEIALLLRRRKKHVILVGNKADASARELMASELWELGFGEPVTVSAEHGLGTGDLLDRVIGVLPERQEEPAEPQETRLAIVGRPNVGKSSLVNALVSERRVIVSPVPGTTRDAVDVTWSAPGGQVYTLTDTAGLRRRTKIAADVERFSVLRALRAIVRSQLVVLVVDATSGITAQERRIASNIARAGKAAVIAVNKWDIAPDDRNPDQWRELIATGLGSMRYARVAFTSALTGMGIDELAREIELAGEAYGRQIQTAELNRALERMTLTMPPAGSGHRRLRIYYATQIATRPPTFTMFVNDPESVTPVIERYLEGRMRTRFDFDGTPIRFRARPRQGRQDKPDRR